MGSRVTRKCLNDTGPSPTGEGTLTTAREETPSKLTGTSRPTSLVRGTVTSVVEDIE